MAVERKPNEVLVSVELMEQLVRQGLPRTYCVTRGPEPEARIVNVRRAGDRIVLEYDRPVEEPMLSVVHATGGIAKPGAYLVDEAGPEQITR